MRKQDFWTAAELYTGKGIAEGIDAVVKKYRQYIWDNHGIFIDTKQSQNLKGFIVNGESIEPSKSPDRCMAIYSPAETAAIRMGTVSDIVDAQRQLLQRAPTKIPLNDLPAVQKAADDFKGHCAELGVLPTVELFAAALGHSRRNFYDFLQRHTDSPTAGFLDRLRTLWAWNADFSS